MARVIPRLFYSGALNAGPSWRVIEIEPNRHAALPCFNRLPHNPLPQNSAGLLAVTRAGCLTDGLGVALMPNPCASTCSIFLPVTVACQPAAPLPALRAAIGGRFCRGAVVAASIPPAVEDCAASPFVLLRVTRPAWPSPAATGRRTDMSGTRVRRAAKKKPTPDGVPYCPVLDQRGDHRQPIGE